jgi:hypothetical protein
LNRLRRAVLTFFRSEREEAALRVALDDAGAFLRDAPETRTHKAQVKARMLAFMNEALPDVPHPAQVFAADFVVTSMGAVAKKITEQGRSRSEVDTWARAMAEMYCEYLAGLAKKAPSQRNG